MRRKYIFWLPSWCATSLNHSNNNMIWTIWTSSLYSCANHCHSIWTCYLDIELVFMLLNRQAAAHCSSHVIEGTTSIKKWEVLRITNLFISLGQGIQLSTNSIKIIRAMLFTLFYFHAILLWLRVKRYQIIMSIANLCLHVVRNIFVCVCTKY